MTGAEFDRRYDAMPGVRAELIRGRVYVMSSPVSMQGHAEPHAELVTWAVLYRRRTPGVRAGDNGTLLLGGDDRPQPDVCLRVEPELGGLSRTEGNHTAGPVEFVAEVAASSVSYDLHDKYESYEQCGVREYVVYRVQDGAVDWFILRGGRYEPLPPGGDGIYRSEVLPGLWLDPVALAGGDIDRIIEILDRGLASPEHAAFVAELQARAGH